MKVGSNSEEVVISVGEWLAYIYKYAVDCCLDSSCDKTACCETEFKDTVSWFVDSGEEISCSRGRKDDPDDSDKTDAIVCPEGTKADIVAASCGKTVTVLICLEEELIEFCCCTSGDGGLVTGNPASVSKGATISFHGLCKGEKDDDVTLNGPSPFPTMDGKGVCGNRLSCVSG